MFDIGSFCGALTTLSRAALVCCLPLTLLACQQKPAQHGKAPGPQAAKSPGSPAAMDAMGRAAPGVVAPRRAAPPVANASLRMVGRYKSANLRGAETLHVQPGGTIAALCDSKKGAVEIVDISNPRKIKLVANHPLGLRPGEEATSVVMHGKHGYYLVAVQGSGVHRRGRVELRSIATGKRLASVTTGVGPDAISLSQDGRFAAVSNEGEPFSYDPKLKEFDTAGGSVTLVHLFSNPLQCTAVEFHLPTYAVTLKRTGRDAMDRMLERAVDWNGNGKIDKQVDFNGNGRIDKKPVQVGKFRNLPIMAEEGRGERFLFPARMIVAAIMEPEYAAFSPSGDKIYLAVQEANLMAVLDRKKMVVERYFDLGITSHRADMIADGKFKLGSRNLSFFREPDGLAVSPSGRYLITSDEGDSVPPRPGEPQSHTHGGGRTLSVFDLTTGKVLGDTGSQIDEQAAKVGAYPDERSVSKGSEPEEVRSFLYGGVLYAVVSLERADGVALVSLANPRQPKVLQVVSMHAGKRGTYQPEGIDIWKHPKENAVYVFTADAETGTMSVFRVAGPGQ